MVKKECRKIGISCLEARSNIGKTGSLRNRKRIWIELEKIGYKGILIGGMTAGSGT